MRGRGAGVGGHRRHLTGGPAWAGDRARTPAGQGRFADGVGVDQPDDLVGRDPGGGQIGTGHDAGEGLPLRLAGHGEDHQAGPGDARKVRVIRSWGLLALGSRLATTSTAGSSMARAAESGKSEAVWPSGPSPRWTRSKAGEGGDHRLVVGGGVRRGPRPVHGMVGAHRPDRVEQGLGDHPVVGVRVVGGDAPLVAQVDIDVVPVDAAPRVRRPRPGWRSTPRPCRRRTGTGRSRSGGVRPGARPPAGQRRREPRGPTVPFTCSVHPGSRSGHWGSSVSRPPVSSRSITGLRHSSPERSTSRSAMWGPQVPAA